MLLNAPGNPESTVESGWLDGVATIQQVTSASALPSFQTRFEFMQGHHWEQRTIGPWATSKCRRWLRFLQITNKKWCPTFSLTWKVHQMLCDVVFWPPRAAVGIPFGQMIHLVKSQHHSSGHSSRLAQGHSDKQGQLYEVRAPTDASNLNRCGLITHIQVTRPQQYP